MRFMVILLGVFGGMVIVEQAFVPLRISQLSAAGMNLTIIGSILLFASWAIATALVYRFPAVSLWLYTIGGVIGLYAGITDSFRSLVTWGIAANVMAVLCVFARQEKRIADLRRRERERQLADLLTAVQAIRLAETPPAMLPVEWQVPQPASPVAGPLMAMATEPATAPVRDGLSTTHRPGTYRRDLPAVQALRT